MSLYMKLISFFLVNASFLFVLGAMALPIFSTQGSRQGKDAVYSVPFASVPSTSRSLNARSADFGNCVCDLTNGICDVNCCCDTRDCSSGLIQGFSCLPERFSFGGRNVCLSDSSVVFTNTPAGITVQRGTQQSLCVLYDNSAVLGEFFDTVSDFSAAQTQRSVDSQPYSFARNPPTLESESLPSTTTSTTPYTYGQAVRAISPLSPTAGVGDGMPLPGPAAGSSLCQDSSSVRFQVNIPENPFSSLSLGVAEGVDGNCVRIVSDLSTNCASAFSASQYTTSVSVYKTPFNLDSSNTISFSSSNIRIFRAFSSSSTSILLNDGIPLSFDASLLTSSFAGSTCSNAVQSVEYLFTYNSNTKEITSVSADIVIVNLAVDTALSNRLGISEAVSLRQVFKSRFVTQSTPTTTPVPRDLSGHPGYRNGYPVLAGLLTTSGSVTAVNQFVDGLSLSVAGGSCPFVNGEPLRRAARVLFNTNAVYSCSLSLSSVQLANLCQSFSLWEAFSVNATHIGRYGNASVLESSQWISITKQAFPSPTWDASTSRCSNLVTGMALTFATVASGVRDNPQRKIVGALVSYQTATWKAVSASANVFELRISVNFPSVDPDTFDKVLKPTPPLLPSIPPDALYPLFRSSASTSISRSIALSLFLPVLLTICIILIFSR